jgi:hypothetical protein
MTSLKLLLDKASIDYTGFIEVGPATLVSPTLFCTTFKKYHHTPEL